MKKLFSQSWMGVLAVVILLGGIWIWLFDPAYNQPSKIAPDYSPQVREHQDHGPLIAGPFQHPTDVTKDCLRCHPDAAKQMMNTSHFRWIGEDVQVPNHDGTTRIGKRNLMNNFCIGIQGNWASCTRCHAGYGWTDNTYDFDNPHNVDCLVCHDRSGTYVKEKAGLPKESVDLVTSAKSVGYPERSNCGVCHAFGGGGLGVKHGDLDNSLNNPTPVDDVHMGRYKMLCIDCHKTKNHNITGRSMSVSITRDNGVFCEDCHNNPPHRDERINTHLSAVACETCHIPTYARRNPTKIHWDWSKAGDASREEDAHSYLKMKGEFLYDNDIIPEYRWYNGRSMRYLLGDKIDPSQVTSINRPIGTITDPSAKIHPFKIHRGKQPYDIKYKRLAHPVTAGEGGYWHTFDWNKALELGSQVTGLPYSGAYGFAETEMYWPLSHMVATSDNALTCGDCHGDSSRFNWQELGYSGDPLVVGGRK